MHTPPIPSQLVPLGKLASADHTLSLDLGHDDKGDGFSFVKKQAGRFGSGTGGMRSRHYKPKVTIRELLICAY